MRQTAATTVLVATLASCGGGQRVTDDAIGHAEQAVAGAHAAVNQAREHFIAWNRTAEAAIVAGATTEAEGLAALAKLDQLRAPITRAFVLAYSALAHAEALLPLIREKKATIDALLPVLSRLAGPVSEINRRVAGLR